MKGLILALGLFAGAASAETITLGSADCGTLRQCYGIPNDSDPQDAITFINGVSSYYASLTINGTIYKGYPVLPIGTMTFTSFPMQAVDGTVALFTGAFTAYKTCTKYCIWHYSLIGGTIQR